MEHLKKLSFTIIFLFFSTAAFAHPGHGVGGLPDGLLHPVQGIDHLLTALAIGVWAAQIGGRALWAFPATFIISMIMGSLFGFEGHALPFQDSGILVSLLFLGIALLLPARIKTLSAASLIALFGFVHGNAHGSEMTAGLSTASYTVGFVLSTSLLHLSGIAGVTSLKIFMSETHARFVTQSLGVIIIASAGLMTLGVF